MHLCFICSIINKKRGKTKLSKRGEIDYLKNIGEYATLHAVNKPFMDDNCEYLLLHISIILSLLPPPPIKLLDLGCGTGWTSCFFAKRGYNVTGIDISPDMIKYAEQNKVGECIDNLNFSCCNYEEMAYNANFECAVFYDSLHHAENESLAIQKVYDALIPGGICVTMEPGKGHDKSQHSQEAMRKYDVTEKDMQPKKIISLAKRAGFRHVTVYPMPIFFKAMYGQNLSFFTRFYKMLKTPLLVPNPLNNRLHSGFVLMVK